MRFSQRLALFAGTAVLMSGVLCAGTPGISQEKLKEHVSFLASGRTEGRLAGSEGGARTEKYIKRYFGKYGLKPLPGCDGFAQNFSFTSNVSLAEGNAVVFNPQDMGTIVLVPGKDFVPASFSEDCDIEGAEMVFAGFGIRSKDPERNDYAGLDIKDRVAVVFRDGPEGDDPKSPYAPFYSSRFKASTAKEMGARALIVVSQEGTADELPKMKSGAPAGTSSIPVISMKLEFLKKLFGAEGRPFPDKISAGMEKPFAFGKSTVSMKIRLVREKSTASNIAGFLPASVPTDETIIIGAHWDHLGRGIEGSLAEKYGKVHPGADDNGSGTAGLLELARAFSSQKERAKNIIFAAFAAEELGGLGSVYFTKYPPVPMSNITAMINLDMIGRFREKLIVDGTGTAKEWKDILDAANREKLPLSLHEDGYGASDHSSFYARSIPVLFFFTGAHGDYHLPSDTADKVNYCGEAKILELVKNVVNETMNLKERPTYLATTGNGGAGKASFKVYVGTVPDFTEEGKGFKILSVRPGSPAEKAGIKGGDLLVSLGGRKIENIYDYTYALQDFKPGDEAEALLVRDGKEIALKLVFGARKVVE